MNYASIAHFYDLLHATLGEDRDFLLRRAAERSGPILELGSGTGRLLLPLAEAGYTVFGLDNDGEMLAIANQKRLASTTDVRERLTLIEADARKFSLEERFGLIAVMHNTFMHFDRQDRRRVLTQARRHLLPDGRLFIDVANPNEVVANTAEHVLQLERNELLDDTGERLLQFSTATLDAQEQVLRVTWIFDVSPVEGGTIRRFTAQTDYHLLYAHELELQLDETGFELVELLGDYHAVAYEEYSPRLIVVARLQ
ncbi:MAG: class I SAM-dependent methyltransferase [Candidatus Promineifilaceae bacterium]|nr:class I SAM-dependent methyltransferase [Candidatus Promineifilaceae bacterium]